MAKRVRPSRNFGRIFGTEAEADRQEDSAPGAEKPKLNEHESTLNFDR